MEKGISPDLVWKTMKAVTEMGLDLIKTENLYTFDGKLGYTEAQSN